MIQANELRIDNVFYFAGGVATISGIFDLTQVWVAFEKKELKINLKKLNPIPLTPEILESAGFEKSEDDLGDFEFCFEDSLGNRIDKENGFYKYWYGERYAGYVELKYLHQLQNTYPVFNDWKELTINLHATV